MIHLSPQLVTIENPGSFRITICDALFDGLFDPRNQTFVKLFNLLRKGERTVSGIPTTYTVWKSQDREAPLLLKLQKYLA